MINSITFAKHIINDFLHYQGTSYFSSHHLPWQLKGAPEQYWAKCERRAANLCLLSDLAAKPNHTPPKLADAPPDYTPPPTSSASLSKKTCSATSSIPKNAKSDAL